MEFIGYVNEKPSLVDGVLCFENGDYRMMDKAGDYVYATAFGNYKQNVISIDKHVTREELSPIEVLVTPCDE
jgi:hypothetical protein